MKKQKKEHENKKQEPLNALKQELEKTRNLYLRAVADYQNLEKRMWNDRERLALESARSVLIPLLEIKDDIDAAEEFEKNQGLRLIKKKFDNIIKSLNINILNPKGQEFSPETMECVHVEEGEKNNIVTRVHQKGYALGKNLLRPAKVTVSKIR